MGQKTHPLGFRLGITEFDRSVWFSPQYPRHGALQLSKYAQEVLEDHYIRKTLFKKFPNANIADIEIHRKRVNQRWNSITLLLRAEIVEQFVGLNSKDVLKEVRKALKEELTSFRTHSLCLSTDFEENYFLNSTSKNVSSSKILSTINIKSSSPCLRTTLKPKKEDLREQKTAQIELKGLPQRYRHNASSNSFTPLTDRITFVVVKVTQHWAKAYSIARFLATRLERRERVRCNVMDVLRRMRREDKANRKKVNKSLPLKRFEQDRANTSLSLSKLSLSKQSSQSKQSVFQKHGIPVVRQRLLFFKEVLHRLEKRFQKTLVSNIVLINQEQPIRPERQRVKGIKIQLSGRLNGVEIARTVWSRIGRVPLQTLRAGVDYTYLTAKTIYGLIGIKVWVFRTPLTTSNQWEHLSVPQVWSLSTNAPIWSDIVSRFVPKSQKNWQVIIKQLFTKTELERWDKEWNKAQNKTNQKNKRPGRRF